MTGVVINVQNAAFESVIFLCTSIYVPNKNNCIEYLTVTFTKCNQNHILVWFETGKLWNFIEIRDINLFIIKIWRVLNLFMLYHKNHLIGHWLFTFSLELIDHSLLACLSNWSLIYFLHIWNKGKLCQFSFIMPIFLYHANFPLVNRVQVTVHLFLRLAVYLRNASVHWILLFCMKKYKRRPLWATLRFCMKIENCNSARLVMRNTA